MGNFFNNGSTFFKLIDRHDIASCDCWIAEGQTINAVPLN
jgi:hypothetical protein